MEFFYELLTNCFSCIIISFVAKHVTNVRLAQLDRAFGYGPKGREIETSNAHVKPRRHYVFKVFLLTFMGCEDVTFLLCFLFLKHFVIRAKVCSVYLKLGTEVRDFEKASKTDV